MGRQIAILLSEEKEKEFIDFILSDYNIEFIHPWSKNKELNKSKKLQSREIVYIWNKKFDFIPEFVEIKPKYRYRVKNNKYGFRSSGKPVIEYFNGNKENPGRIYWGKYFTKSKLTYNLIEFEKWYNSLVRWIKKNCKYENGVYV